MRVVRIVYSGLRVVYCAYGIDCVDWVMRVILWCNLIHDSNARDRLELLCLLTLIDWEQWRMHIMCLW